MIRPSRGKAPPAFTASAATDMIRTPLADGVGGLEGQRHGARPWRLAIALVFLNLTLTFDNLWPTPAIVPGIALSLESLVLALLLVLAAQRGPAGRARIVSLVALAATVLACGRYVEVTIPAFFGRPVNLYWDGRHLPNLLTLAWQQNPLWKSLAVAAGVLALLAVVYGLIRAAAGCIARELGAGGAVMRRRVGVGLVGVVVASLAVAHLPAVGSAGVGRHTTLRDYVTTPVIANWVRQGAFLVTALSGSRAEQLLPASVPFTGDIAGLRGADVVLVFAESYGATAFDHPGYAARLRQHRDGFAAAIAAAKREVLSAFVRSPTFGGGSWLAHASFLAGIEVGDPAQYDLLLTTRRPTLVGFLREHGYETVALMPGIRADWPEGSFYGFDELIDSRGLDYHGPAFGYWRIPDQYAMARHLALRQARPDKPRFLFFPTVTSHIPFDPVPPYQPDWTRLLGAEPYPPAAIAQSLSGSPDWLNLGPAYADTLAYTYDWLTGYLAQPAVRDYLLVVVGDHQPAASVSGRGASWEVPVHVVTGDPVLARRLESLGFNRGLDPRRPALGAMSDLSHLLVRAAGVPGPARSHD